jgi:hypothetical protein
MRNSFDVPIDPAERPFTARIRELHDRHGRTYLDMENVCAQAYSQAWFNTLARAADPWHRRTPPKREHAPILAAMMRTDEATLREWIAREWYGVASTPTSPRVRNMAANIDALTEAQADAVATVLNGLAPRGREFLTVAK